MNEKDKRMCRASESMAVSLNSIANSLNAFQQMFTVMLEHASKAQPPTGKDDANSV